MQIILIAFPRAQSEGIVIQPVQEQTRKTFVEEMKDIVKQRDILAHQYFHGSKQVGWANWKYGWMLVKDLPNVLNLPR